MFFNKRQITVDRMIELEIELSKSKLAEFQNVVSGEELAEELGLKVSYVPPQSFDLGVEAELVVPKTSDYYGEIRILNSLAHTPFAFMHEIVHYVFDVGYGNKVSETYSRKIKGMNKPVREQEVDYIAAANCMRYDKILAAIREYDNASPRMNANVFVNGLCVKYGQDRRMVVRRIREVRSIYKKNGSIRF